MDGLTFNPLQDQISTAAGNGSPDTQNEVE